MREQVSNNVSQHNREGASPAANQLTNSGQQEKVASASESEFSQFKGPAKNDISIGSAAVGGSKEATNISPLHVAEPTGAPAKAVKPGAEESSKDAIKPSVIDPSRWAERLAAPLSWTAEKVSATFQWAHSFAGLDDPSSMTSKIAVPFKWAYSNSGWEKSVASYGKLGGALDFGYHTVMSNLHALISENRPTSYAGLFRLSDFGIPAKKAGEVEQVEDPQKTEQLQMLGQKYSDAISRGDPEEAKKWQALFAAQQAGRNDEEVVKLLREILKAQKQQLGDVT